MTKEQTFELLDTFYAEGGEFPSLFSLFLGCKVRFVDPQCLITTFF